MTSPAIKVENLSKRYRIGERAGYKTIRESLANLVKSSSIKDGPKNQNGKPDTIWALKDVCFEVQPGEVVGIIGRNGAGKSTLLKILSKITDPTEGRVEIRGRVGSLLEIGTGFHPELTGHENIYLYGAILGMDRWEVTRKFDEIVAFAEIEQFIETPVKRYSSGMYMRLAFAVAAHMETEILLVDEVLAVGDIAFQKKCLGMMDSVASEGRTVLFVSHNMGAIRKLCSKSILLDKGSISYMGSPVDSVYEYEKREISQIAASWTNDNKQDMKQIAYVKSVEVLGIDFKPKNKFMSSDAVFLKFTISVRKRHSSLKVGFDLLRHGNIVFRSQHIDSPNRLGVLPEGIHELICEIPSDFLNAGTYYVKLLLSIHLIQELSSIENPIVKFEIVLNTGRSAFHFVLNERNHPGSLFPLLTWDLK
jgi:lipopolysaccharide transport system ATP-binding protein